MLHVVQCSTQNKLSMSYVYVYGTNHKSGLEFIKLKFTRVRKQPIIALYFEFETVLKFYYLEAWSNIFI